MHPNLVNLKIKNFLFPINESALLGSGPVLIHFSVDFVFILCILPYLGIKQSMLIPISVDCFGVQRLQRVP